MDSDADDPITSMRFSKDGSTWGNWRAYQTSVPYPLTGQGTETVYVEYENAAGTVSAPASANILVDTLAPTIAAAPVVAIAKTALVSGTPSLRVSWSGSDAGSGINHYTLQKSVDGGAFSTVTLPSPTATSVTLVAPVGHTYTFQIEAADNAGNTSAYEVGATHDLTLTSEKGSGITYSAGWTRTALSGAGGGFVEQTMTNKATATFRFTGIGVAFVSVAGPAFGEASYVMDGDTASTVTNHHAGTTLVGQVPYAQAVSSGAHKLVITDKKSGAASRLDVDSFLVLT